MNRAILIGRIVKDLELRYTKTNMACLDFSVAISNGKDKEGNNRTDFINCMAWDKQAENMAKYCQKGSLISIEGSIKNDSWKDETGITKYKSYVLVNRVTFLNTSKNGQNLANNEQKQENSMNTNEQRKNDTDDVFEQFGNELDIPESQLPF